MSSGASDTEELRGLPQRHVRHNRLLRSAGVRFAIFYALVFGISAIVLAGSLYYSTIGLLGRQTHEAIRVDARSLAAHFEAGGLTGLVLTLDSRISEDINDHAIYLLVDPLGNRIAGNMSRWPQGINTAHVWYQVPLERGGRKSTALMRYYELPGGFQLLVGRDVSTRAQLRRILRDGLLWALAAMAFLGVLGAIVIRGLFKRSLADISGITRAIARGDLTRRVRRSGNGDEFDELAETINDMLDRIAKLMDGVREVSNSIAHDLRTPITRARARLEDAAAHARTTEELQSAVERATLDLDGIVNVFQALLRIAEIEAGARRSAFRDVDLAPVLDDLAEFFDALAEERGILIVRDWPKSIPIFGDRDMLQQAVSNLLDNAIKFSRETDRVVIAAHAGGGHVEIQIADHGPGIPEADLSRATERFYRAEAARSTPGSGLGLALVSAIAQLHGGSLLLENNEPGLRARLILSQRDNAPPQSPRQETASSMA
ncbi:HAMP domain-containing sensor histidine kinase [Acidiphilium sp.]|uniref:sensor histidine kinase n=1 Tax=Acidiphilium sp. TaxID=527 RepID=UPI0025860925|nr:ATP-binding protein [Acidiphilium sp.]